MFTFVNIGRFYLPGEDPKPHAIRDRILRSKKLLSTGIQNSRLLVPHANKRVLSVYLITGIVEVTQNLDYDKKCRIFFEVEDLPQNLELELISILQWCFDNNNKSLIYNFSILTRTPDQLDISMVVIHSLLQELNNTSIKTLQTRSPQNTIQENTVGDVSKLKDNLWYKITIEYHSFSSFRTPVEIDTKTIISLSQSGIMNIDKEVNSIRVNASLDKSSKNRVIQLIQLFNNDPKSLLHQLNASDKLNHVAHFNPISIEIKAFSDAAQQHVVRQFSWQDDVAFAKSGLVSIIFRTFIH